MKKYFSYQDFLKKSGGIILDKEFLDRKNKVQENREYYLKQFNIDEKYDFDLFQFSLMKRTLINFLKTLQKLDKKVLLLLLSEKTQKNFIKYFDNNDYYDKIKAVKLPFFTYDKYEELLALCDI